MALAFKSWQDLLDKVFQKLFEPNFLYISCIIILIVSVLTRQYEYTREILLKFKEEMAAKKEKAAKGVQPADGGFGGFGTAGVAAENRVRQHVN